MSAWKAARGCRAGGPAILAANHVSFFDSVVLIMTVRRTLSFVGKVEYLDSWKTRRLLPAFGMIPVDRSDGRRAVASLKIAAGVLRAGRMFAIYPEGTRSADGDLHAGHTGAAYLSMATGVPIVPTGIVGTDRIQPPGHKGPASVPTGHGSVRQPDRPGRLRRQSPPPSAADHHRRDDRDPNAVGPEPSLTDTTVHGITRSRAACSSPATACGKSPRWPWLAGSISPS